MPTRPRTPCPYPGCHELVGYGHCDAHRKQRQSVTDAYRGTRTARGYDYAWSKTRRLVLTREPLCRTCRGAGRTTVATEVDHIVPLKAGGGTGANLSNLQPLCKPCHSSKTIAERGAVFK